MKNQLNALESKIGVASLKYFRGVLLQERTLSASYFRISELYPSVIRNEEFEQSIRDSVRKDGLLYPLVIIENTESVWDSPPMQAVYSPLLSPRDLSLPYLVLVGNNRLWIAKEEGYEFISCFKLSAIEELYPTQVCLGQLQNARTFD